MIRVYLSGALDPILVEDTGRRMIEVSGTWWAEPIACARTTVEGAEVYVELERPMHGNIIPIRRDARAMAVALGCEKRARGWRKAGQG